MATARFHSHSYGLSAVVRRSCLLLVVFFSLCHQLDVAAPLSERGGSAEQTTIEEDSVNVSGPEPPSQLVSGKFPPRPPPADKKLFDWPAGVTSSQQREQHEEPEIAVLAKEKKRSKKRTTNDEDDPDNDKAGEELSELVKEGDLLPSLSADEKLFDEPAGVPASRQREQNEETQAVDQAKRDEEAERLRKRLMEELERAGSDAFFVPSFPMWRTAGGLLALTIMYWSPSIL